MKLFSIVLVYSNFQKIKDLIEKISKLDRDVILAKDIERGLGFLNFNNVQIFAIDSSYKLNETDLIKLQNINNELFLINFETGTGPFITSNESSEVNKHKYREFEIIKKKQTSVPIKVMTNSWFCFG